MCTISVHSEIWQALLGGLLMRRCLRPVILNVEHDNDNDRSNDSRDKRQDRVFLKAVWPVSVGSFTRRGWELNRKDVLQCAMLSSQCRYDITKDTKEASVTPSTAVGIWCLIPSLVSNGYPIYLPT